MRIFPASTRWRNSIRPRCSTWTILSPSQFFPVNHSETFCGQIQTEPIERDRCPQDLGS
jgi:hypothetical protein